MLINDIFFHIIKLNKCALLQWCQWELNLIQQVMFEKNTNFLILVELARLSRDNIPSPLRLLMSTRTYLECPREGNDMTSFWYRLKFALGPPISNLQSTIVEPESASTTSNDMFDQMYDDYMNSTGNIDNLETTI